MAKTTSSLQTSSGASVRCAIYTRKSTDEGLEQEFNSLDAQREACAAYVTSQRHEGWVLLPDYYDDGGYSGGNMDRPGLKRLLADVQAGKVDVIVVYKVDRLTRALSDFARIVEILDSAGASFVSITQSFNTTTSMGRLTLNVLLSFAQFEREVGAERVRDKIAASKRKGMWMGGAVPLGYEVVDRRLVPNPAEAETVRHIMRRYLEVGSVRTLMDSLKREGVRSKLQTLRDGRRRGGIPFVRGPLYCLLKNPIYIGQIPHRKARYPGQHEAIVPRELWDEVQALLARNGADRQFGTNAADPSLLAGLVQDEQGRVLTPSHASKGSRRYRYYLTAAGGEGEGPAAPRGIRIPAGEIEQLITRGVAAHLSDRRSLAEALAPFDLDFYGVDDSIRRWAATASLFETLPIADRRVILIQLDVRVVVDGEQVRASYNPARLCSVDTSICGTGMASEGRVNIPLRGLLVRRGPEMRLVYQGEDKARHRRRDAKLVSLIAKGEAARAELRTACDGERGAAVQIRRAHLARLARANYLAPDIIQAVLDGTQPPELTARQILKAADIPLSWEDQRLLFGFKRLG